MTEPQKPSSQPTIVEMGRRLNLVIASCKQCPYAYEGIYKGLTNGEFHCRQVYDDRPNFQGSCRRLGNQYTYGPIPEWCPLEINVLG